LPAPPPISAGRRARVTFFFSENSPWFTTCPHIGGPRHWERCA
jgi:hypothetical protein